MLFIVFVSSFSTQPKFDRSSILSNLSIRCFSNCIVALVLLTFSILWILIQYAAQMIVSFVSIYMNKFISSPAIYFRRWRVSNLENSPRRCNGTPVLCIPLELWSKIEFSFHVHHHQLTPQSHRVTFFGTNSQQAKLMVGKYSDLSFKGNFPNRCYIFSVFLSFSVCPLSKKYTLYLSLSFPLISFLCCSNSSQNWN